MLHFPRFCSQNGIFHWNQSCICILRNFISGHTKDNDFLPFLVTAMPFPNYWDCKTLTDNILLIRWNFNGKSDWYKTIYEIKLIPCLFPTFLTARFFWNMCNSIDGILGEVVAGTKKVYDIKLISCLFPTFVTPKFLWNVYGSKDGILGEIVAGTNMFMT